MENRERTNKSTPQEKSIIEEIQLKEILDKMIEGVQIIGFDWTHLYVNDSVVKQSHFQKHELIGYTMMERYPGIEQSEVFKILKECMDTRTIKQKEIDFQFPDGRKAWFELSIQPIKEGIFILSVDVTERKEAQGNIVQLNQQLEAEVDKRTSQLELKIQQLRESEEKFNKAFHASSAGITITSLSDSIIIDANESAAKLTGYSKEEMIGKTAMGLGIVTDDPVLLDIQRELKEKGSARSFEISLRSRSGKILKALSSVEIILLNNIPYALSIFYDITERKNAEEQLATVNKELEAFTYSVSHDLRAPLRSITGYSQILDEELKDTNEEAKRMLAVIRKNALKMNQLIDKLLEFSKLGTKELQRTEIISESFVKNCVNALTTESPIPNTEVRINTLHNVNADQDMLQQVWTNLISNAFKYSSKKEKPVVEIGSTKEKNEVVFYIKDNGAGFDMDYADKLFKVFQRLHKYSDFEGTGVGLSIVKRIVAKHGGNVWAEGKAGEGATFYFSIPEY